MQLTRYSDYSLRVLMYLAVRPEYLATIEEIAGAYGISRAHLMKVVHQLGRAGFVDTVRGRGGGIQLARAPEQISIGGVVRRTEDKLAIVECFEPSTSQCRIESACGLRGVLEEALDAFLGTLDRYTLADLVARRRKPLVELLTLT
jgi:Rrf2 family nitric oxide-sensitive transcriptional repressor